MIARLNRDQAVSGLHNRRRGARQFIVVAAIINLILPLVFLAIWYRGTSNIICKIKLLVLAGFQLYTAQCSDMISLSLVAFYVAMAVLFNVILIATLYLYRIDVRRARRGQWMWAAFLYIVSMYIGFFRPGDALLKHGLYPGFISVMIPSIFVGALLPFLIIALLSPPREES